MRVTVRARGFAALCVALALAGCGEDPEIAERARTRGIMREIFAGLKVALPLSGDAEAFRDPANEPRITAALTVLTRNASTLEEHTRGKESQLDFLARSVASDAREIERTYANGRYERATFLLHEIVENCIACHTRLPARRDAIVSAGFVDSAPFVGMPAESRSNLLIATRRFDAALDSLEAQLDDPNQHVGLLLGPLTDFLVVSIRVKGDYKRPLPVLERLAARKEAWTKLRQDVEAWRAALPELERRAAAEASVETARELVEEGELLDVFPGDMGSRLHLVVASAVLERFIETHEERDAELAEAYYLLGIIEARIGRNYWVTPAPFLLTEAVRIAPKTPTAEQAYAVLERELLRSYEGSEHEELPEEDQAQLDALQELMRGS